MHSVKVGDKGYTYQPKGGGYISAVRHPVKVIAVTEKTITLESVEPIFDPNDNYFDSLPIGFDDTKKGDVKVYHWSDKLQAFQDNTVKGYPQVFVNSGNYEYFPYLD